MKRWFRNNGLSAVMFGLFLLFLAGQGLAGWRHYNQEQAQHQQPAVGLASYLRSGDFLEAVFENWESEFFQMAAFLILSAMLVQRGSAESKQPQDQADDDRHEREQEKKLRRPPPDAPWPVHRGGLALKLYSRSLSLALAALFLLSFTLHAITGQMRVNEQAAAHGGAPVTVAQYLLSSTFWFEAFQNWQSEFLSVGALIVLSIFLRQKGSPESKPVHAAHAQTGA